MDTQDNKAQGRYTDRGNDTNAHAADVLRKLDEICAIKLDVLVSRAAEIKAIVGGSGGISAELEPGDICYPYMVKIGPRLDFDLVSVANQLRQLGFEVKRMTKM